MNLDQFINSRIIAIKVNFSSRNVKVYPENPKRQKQLARQRRKTVKRFIAEFRAAKDPVKSKIVSKLIANMVY